jgi:hypothetical protein
MTQDAGPPEVPADGSAVERSKVLHRLGITRVPADHFLLGGFRCITMAGAIAQAQRSLGEA